MILLRRLLGDVLGERRRDQGRTLREVSAAARVSLASRGHPAETPLSRKSFLRQSGQLRLGLAAGPLL